MANRGRLLDMNVKGNKGFFWGLRRMSLAATLLQSMRPSSISSAPSSEIVRAHTVSVDLFLVAWYSPLARRRVPGSRV